MTCSTCSGSATSPTRCRRCSRAASANAWPSHRALANQPTLLLADEPTGALDTEGGREVLELFRRLHGDGQTIIMVTHSDEVAAGASRIVRMRDGRIDGGAEAPVETAPAVAVPATAAAGSAE